MNCNRPVMLSPLILLSVADHYKRMSSPRVVGVLLGTKSEDTVRITNSFAIPFEESIKGFFIDTSYLREMYDLYRKISVEERIVGWYHSGPELMASDKYIARSFRQYCDDPVLAIVNVHSGENNIPFQCLRLDYNGELEYQSIEIGADDTEEVGIEYLLRDIKETTGSNLKDKLKDIKNSLRTYEKILDEIVDYLDSIKKFNKEPDTDLLELFQDILNSVPEIKSEPNMEGIYLGELVNTFIAVNDLKKNQRENIQ